MIRPDRPERLYARAPRPRLSAEGIVFVTGPMASGKTLNSAAMLEHFQLKKSIDWYTVGRRSSYPLPQPGDLVLTCERAETIRRHFPDARIYAIEEMREALGARWLEPWPVGTIRTLAPTAPTAERLDDVAMRRERFQRADRLAERILFAVVALACLAVGFGLGWLS